MKKVDAKILSALRNSWKQAGEDRAVPDDLSSPESAMDWSQYIYTAPAGRVLRKLSQSLAQLDEKFNATPRDEDAVRYKWCATLVCANALRLRIGVIGESMEHPPVTAQVVAGIDAVIDFIQSSDLRGASSWKKRRLDYLKMEKSGLSDIVLPYLGHMGLVTEKKPSAGPSAPSP